MYLDFKVDIPVVKGKITYREKAETEYVYYEYDRITDSGAREPCARSFRATLSEF